MSIYDTLRRVEANTKIRCLTCESEIILFLYYNPRSPAGLIFKGSRYSSTSFYGTLRRLSESGVIVCGPDPSDRRYNVYQLRKEFRMMIERSILSDPSGTIE